jgi:hypothetical protein
MCVSGEETEVRDELFPREGNHEKVKHAAKFIRVLISLPGKQPLRLPYQKET